MIDRLLSDPALGQIRPEVGLLGVTSRAWVASVRAGAGGDAAGSGGAGPRVRIVDDASGRVLGGGAAAMEVYRRIFRAGQREAGGVRITPPPIIREHREASPEGEVIKFVSRVEPGAASGGTGRGGVRRGVRRGVLRELGADGVERFRVPEALLGEPLDIESVLIPMMGSTGARTYTLCVSSQVGCAMGCTFCETAQMGLVRSLSAGEIVSQWWNAAHVIGVRPRNIVFMGMGEPLDNYEGVVRAVDVLRDDNGAGVPMSQITISTVGRVDGIRRLAAQVREPGWHRLGLALSLNAPNDADRSAIMPINRRWNLAAVRDALLDWPRFAGNKICVEYVLIPGLNDTPAHADQIREFMAPMGLLERGVVGGRSPLAMLNLIPYNPRRDSPWPAPDEPLVERFLGWLIERGVFAKRRRTKGRRMMGACGQLGAAHIRGRRVVPLTASAGGAASPGPAAARPTP